MKDMNQEHSFYTLNAESIDRVSEEIDQFLDGLGVEMKERLRLRLTAEEVMIIWAEELGEETPCELRMKRSFGHRTINLSVTGKAVDPTTYQDDTILHVSNNPNMVAALGLPAEYIYDSGVNRLKFNVPRKKVQPMKQVLICIAAAMISGFLLRSFLPNAAQAVSTQFVTPLFNTIMRAIGLVAGPLVLLSVLAGITNMDSMSSFGRIGKKVLGHFIGKSFLIGFLIVFSTMWIYGVKFGSSSGGDNSISAIVSMILDIIPSNIVEPFETGNAMQIIFIAVCVGVSCLILGDSVRNAVRITNQLNAIVQLLMSKLGSIMPFFIFLCILNLVLTSEGESIKAILLPLLLHSAICVLVPIFNGIYICARTKTPFIPFMKKLLPTYLICVTTASSSASFATNVECCEKELGIDKRLVNFGVPFGQVIYMLGAIVLLVEIPMSCAAQEGIAFTPSWLIQLFLVGVIMAISAPPVPGGGLSATVVIFAQLGIPESAMATAATVMVFADYLSTACNVMTLQQDLYLVAKKMNMTTKTEL